TQFVIPAKLDERLTSKVQEISLAAHHAIGCYGFSRVDLRLTKDGIPFVLEVNTVPGMTPTSDLPQAAAARGITFSELVRIMLETASQEVTE
ncbi:D-alanine--D-alanine ligase, partial [Candidatus Bipolaricaulota bacterium]|nr:D-alanine--D-alanine ligase [Candidatus Bipolaricaulota bacterium]